MIIVQVQLPFSASQSFLLTACDDVHFKTKPLSPKMDMDKNEDEVLAEKFHFEKLPDGPLEKTKVICKNLITTEVINL